MGLLIGKKEEIAVNLSPSEQSGGSMKIALTLCLALTSAVLQAETIQSKIHAIEDGMIKFENGRVAFLNFDISNLSKNDVLKAELDDRSNLLSYKKMPDFQLRNMSLALEETTPPVFEPTIVQGLNEAWNIFNRSNPKYKRISECTDRAHVWAHDEFKKTGTKSKKVFVFFTASYINSVHFKWWFHVAPLYTVNDGGTIKELVMDYRYTNRPMAVKEWTDHFVYTKRDCKVTTKFSEYDVNPQTENCYLIYESMHYKLPGEIQDQELSGRYKTETSESEIRASLSYAFQN
jgi:hypothetical protein